MCKNIAGVWRDNQEIVKLIWLELYQKMSVDPLNATCPSNRDVRDISRGIRSRQKSGRVGSRSRSGWPIPIFQQIGIGSGWPIPTFQQIGIGSRSLSSNFRDKIGENRDFPRVFPSFLGQKHREKSGKIEESLVTSQLFPILSKKSGKVGISPTFPDLPRLYPTCLENFTSWGRPPRFSNKSGSRLGKPPRFSNKSGSRSGRPPRLISLMPAF